MLNYIFCYRTRLATVVILLLIIIIIIIIIIIFMAAGTCLPDVSFYVFTDVGVFVCLYECVRSSVDIFARMSMFLYLRVCFPACLLCP